MSKYYITDAIPYTNAPAHIGHALAFVQSDVLARYHRALGDDVLLTHGADEHGTKNYQKASELNKKPQAYADEITKKFQEAHTKLNVKYDRFIRTSSPEHAKATQVLWKTLVDKGDIYKGTYKGWYCVGCEEFVSDSHAKDNNLHCPVHEKPYEQLEEDNYFFRLSQYQDQVKSLIVNDELKITPDSRKHEILSVIESGLDDISVSRPVDKLPWGVPVPGDKKHIIYIWFEALICYISALGYPDSEDFETYWPADMQILGKDILRFHAAIWPAMLLAAGLPTPSNLLVHGFISFNGKKLSKSTGNVVDPFEVIEEYGTDPLRYYLLRHIPAGDDGDFTWQKFERAYNSELGNDLGNLAQRLSAMITRYQNGVIGDIPDFEHDEAAYRLAINGFRFDKAMDSIWSMIQGLNQYLEETRPWQIAKTDDSVHLQETLAYAVSSLLQVADLLAPFLPETAEKIQQIFQKGVIDDSVGVLFPKKELYNA